MTRLTTAAANAAPKLSLSAANTRASVAMCQNSAQLNEAVRRNIAASGMRTIRLR